MEQKETSIEEIEFTPRLYIQRYDFILDQVEQKRAASVLDIGCAEGKLMAYLKNNATNINTLTGIDIDLNILNFCTKNIRPHFSDYITKRSSPLEIQIYHGDILTCHTFPSPFDLVCAVEVVEHLPLVDFEVFVNVILRSLQPGCAIITTPNCEYNVLFPDLHGFRHWDHKFELDRCQFHQKCVHLAQADGKYTVSFSGVGAPPLDKESLGHCTQIAIFERIDEADNEKSHSKSPKLIQKYSIPRNTEENLTPQSKDTLFLINHAIETYNFQRSMENIRCGFEVCETNEYPVPISYILESRSLKYRLKKDQLCAFLIQNSWKLDDVCENIISFC